MQTVTSQTSLHHQRHSVVTCVIWIANSYTTHIKEFLKNAKHRFATFTVICSNVKCSLHTHLSALQIPQQLRQNLGGFKSFKRSFSLEPNNLLAINLAIRAGIWNGNSFRPIPGPFRQIRGVISEIQGDFCRIQTAFNYQMKCRFSNWIAGPGRVLKRVALEPTQVKTWHCKWPESRKWKAKP